MIGTWLTLFALLAAIDVQTQGQCPTAADVRRRLEPILPQEPSGAPPAADVAALEERADGTLSVSLSRSDGGLVGRRELPRPASCADQADTVAVTLAVWEAALRADVTLALDRLPSPPGGSAAEPGTAQPVTLSARGPAAARAPSRFLVGASLGLGRALASTSGVAPQVRLEGAWAFRGDTWRLRLTAGAAGEQALDVPPGSVYWQRFLLAAAVDRALARFGPGTKWTLLVGAGPVVGTVRLRGAGFTIDHTDLLADAGAEAVLRLERRFGRWRGWLAVSGAGWVRSQQLEVVGRTPGTPDVTLPRGEAAVALGGSFSIP